MSLTFYFFPFSCSTATHIVLEESGLDYRRELVDLTQGQHRKSNYMALNPKGAVPALLLDSGLLSENHAILTHIADVVPEKKLIPPTGSEQRARAHEWMNYCASSLHQYARMVFRPSAYAGDSLSAKQAVQAQGLTSIGNACNLIERKLISDQWSIGEHFCVSDAYLFIMYLWTRDQRMGDMPDCPKWQALAHRVAKRASTQRIIDVELGLRPDYVMPKLCAQDKSTSD